VGVGHLDADAAPMKVGERVALLGVQERGKRDEDNLFGSVVSSTPTRLEIDLDLPGTLKGWGGAPILRVSNQKVIGIVEAHVSHEGVSRVIAAPIGGVVDALAKPLAAAQGAFANFADVKGAVPPPPAPAIGSAPAGARAHAHAPVLDQHADDPTNVQVDVEYPPPGSVVGNSACGVFVAGQAQAARGAKRRFDVVIVLDTSRSTIDPAGTDINGNGVIGRQRLGGLGTIFGSGSTDPGDSILAAEVAGAKQLLRGLSPRTTRVGLVAFAGDVPGTSRRSRPAYTLVALTDEYERVEAALDEVLATEPEGNTHMAAGVDQATIELAGLRGAASRADAESEKVVFFFTDGQPTLPYGPEAEADNVRAVLRAANRARRANVRIHSFAVGPEALEGPIATVEMASRTDGYFTPVRHPGDLSDVVEEVNIANLESVDLQNHTTKKPARYFRATADGSWAGFIDLDNGKNLLNVTAVADDGATANHDFDVRLEPNAKSPPVPKELAARRNHLLEECLRDLKRRRVTAEQDAAEKVRRELELEIEKEREKAKESADQQRKELELEAVGDDEVDEDKD
jgi:hypothetical protein